MDVRISYGLGLDDVPNKLVDILSCCSERLQKINNLCNLSLGLLEEADADTADMALKIIEKIRAELALADKQAVDVSMILAGFITAKQGGTEASASSPEKVDAD